MGCILRVLVSDGQAKSVWYTSRLSSEWYDFTHELSHDSLFWALPDIAWMTDPTPSSQFMALFERFAIDPLEECAVQGALTTTVIFADPPGSRKVNRGSWRTVDRLLERRENQREH